MMREKLTKSDVEKIQAEIEHRKLVERRELIEAVKEAGDGWAQVFYKGEWGYALMAGLEPD